MSSILLVDDNEALLDDLAAELTPLVGPDVQIRRWVPAREDHLDDVFGRQVDDQTIFVATDYDLTKRGQTGLFGTSVVSWCQARSIPVADFSRGNPGALPKEPDLFELRIPNPGDAHGTARYIATLCRGFLNIAAALRGRPELLDRKSPASVLAGILGVPADESQFALYGVRFGAASGALMAKMADAAAPEIQPTNADKAKLLTYIVGHLLVNAVLRFPGPILSEQAFRGYVASDEADALDVRALFDAALYQGPFAELDRFYWSSTVDGILETLAAALPPNVETETVGEFRRRAIEQRLGSNLRRHGCPRCHGANGGFFCPFTKRTVCTRNDCSVGSNSWIPAGANLCRIERDFFDEWAPLLGL